MAEGKIAMLTYTLKLILLLTILFGLAWSLNIRQIEVERKIALQEENWKYLNHMYHELRYPELWRVFYGYQRKEK